MDAKKIVMIEIYQHYHYTRLSQKVVFGSQIINALGIKLLTDNWWYDC